MHGRRAYRDFPSDGPRILGSAGGYWGLHSGGRRVALVPSASGVSVKGREIMLIAE